jgi:hypothetical protein
MTKLDKPFFTLGCDVGGKEADLAMKEHYLCFRKILSQHCAGPYSNSIDHFHLILRIDGDVHAWNLEGVHFTRLQRSSRYATADIFVPISTWMDRSQEKIVLFLNKHVEEAALALMTKIQKSKIPFESGKLVADLNKAINIFALHKCD